MDDISGWKPSFTKYTLNFNEQVRSGNVDPVSARDKEITQLTTILSRRTKNNPLIIGDPGVGKTAIVAGFVQKMLAKQVPQHLWNKLVLQLNFSSLTAGARHIGEFEERLKELFTDISSSHDIILFIDDAHLLLQSNNDHGKAADILKKYLDSILITVIGVTTNEQYAQYFDKNKSFERYFQPLRIEEPDEIDAFSMLQSEKKMYEQFHKVVIPDEILKYALALSIKHIPARLLPDKALDLIDEAASHVKLAIEKGKRRTNILKRDDLERTISEWIGVPVTKLTKDESKQLLMLEKLVHKKFVGQEHAVTTVSDAIRRGRIGLGSSSRPVASFLFYGSSGVGKSELVKVLSEIIHESEDALLQIDMSEYMEKQDVSKLIGAPPGYVGYEAGGILTEAVMNRPARIILFDNIEKAHIDVSNILLQILEEGYLTDNRGKKANFKNTIIVCSTTNDSAAAQEEVKKLMTPEIINRFDSIVPFHLLSSEDMLGISRLLVQKTALLLKKEGFNFQITNSAVSKLASDGFSPKEGARPLRKVITEVIENPVAVAIISKKFNTGDTLVVGLKTNNEYTVSNGTVTILKSARIAMPGIKDLAQYDSAHMKAEHEKMQEVDNIYSLLKNLAKIDAVTDPDEKKRLLELKNLLMAEKTNGNPTADVILQAMQSLTEEKPGALTLPEVNTVQTVTDEDFEEVRAIWEKNYLDKNEETVIEAHIAYVKKDNEATENILKLFTSGKQEDKDAAIQGLVTILPVLLIGGFSREQIINYLEVKSQAAKSALAVLTEEQETLVSVKKSTQKPHMNTLHAQPL